MSNYYLIIWNEGYADEFDVYGFERITDLQYYDALDKLNSLLKKDPYLYANAEEEYYFGTNEYIEFTMKDFHQRILKARLLSESENQVICNIFTSYRGAGICFWDMFIDKLNEYVK